MPLPNPKKNEKQSEFVSRCVSFVKGEDTKMDNKQAVAMCYTQWKNSKQSSELIKFNYQVPIEISESAASITDEADFIIAGTAINATTTSNNHKFLAEELRSSAQSLIGVPLLTDHENKVENIKGRVKWAEFDELGQKIPFKAIVKDSKIREMIKDGLINSVSVGAAVRDIEEEDGVFIPRGIEFKELSLVAVPADMGATFQVAMKEAYETQKSHSTMMENYKDERRLDTMEGENSEKVAPEAPAEEVKTEEKTEEVKDEVKAEPEVATEKADSKLLEEIKSLKEEVRSLKAVKEEASDDSEDDEDEVEEAYKVLQGNRSFSVVRNKY